MNEVELVDDPNSVVYHVDGELVPAASATVHVEDRGFAYGDAAFETMRAYGGEVFRWDAHAERLADTCDALALDHGLSDAALRERIDETLAANEFEDAAVRCSITRGSQRGVLDPLPTVDPTVIVTVKPLPRGGIDAETVHDGPATMQTTKTRKPARRALPADAKTHNYLNSVLARLELRVTNADEALMLDPDGTVAGGAAATLFFVDGTALKTPSLDGAVYPGVTRQTVIELAEREGFPVEEGTYTPDDVREADEVFLTNSRWQIRPVTTVDGIEIGRDGDEEENNRANDHGTGPLTTLLARLYDHDVEETHYDGERIDG